MWSDTPVHTATKERDDWQNPPEHEKNTRKSKAPLPLALITALSDCGSLTVGVSAMLQRVAFKDQRQTSEGRRKTRTWYLLSSRNGMPRYLSENADAVQMRSDKFLTEPLEHDASAAAKHLNKVELLSAGARTVRCQRGGNDTLCSWESNTEPGPVLNCLGV